MPLVHRIAPCLWFDDQAEEAARFYVEIFPDSQIREIARFSDVGQEIHGRPGGSVMTVDFVLSGQPFTALNGGPVFRFNEAVSLQVFCETQDELDHFWDRLGAGGDERAQQCGWLKDRFGLSWQVVPARLAELFRDHASEGTRRAMAAMLQMKKLDMAELERAFRG